MRIPQQTDDVVKPLLPSASSPESRCLRVSTQSNKPDKKKRKHSDAESDTHLFTLILTNKKLQPQDKTKRTDAMNTSDIWNINLRV